MFKATLFSAAAGAACAHVFWGMTSGSTVAEVETFSAPYVVIDYAAHPPADEDVIITEVHEKPRPRAIETVHQSTLFKWTKEFGPGFESMRELATGPEMLRRMYRQNSYVKRRQLVYVDPRFERLTREISEGFRTEVTLPGFDGQELNVKVSDVESKFEDGVLAWNGHLKDKPAVKVFSSTNGRQHHIGIHYDHYMVRYETRHENEWILNEVDLEALKDARPDVKDSLAKKVGSVLATQ